MKLHSILVTAATDQGLRAENQDNLRLGEAIPFLPPGTSSFAESWELELSETRPGVQVFGLSDGCGGQALGSLASYHALEAVHRALRVLPAAAPDCLLESCMTAADRAIETLNESMSVFTKRKRSAATLTLAVIEQRSAMLFTANLGDSLAFLIRDGCRVIPLSIPDNQYSEALREGRTAPLSARNILTRGLGMDSSFLEAYGQQGGREQAVRALIHRQVCPLRPGDRVLLCSDGFTQFWEPGRIPQNLRRRGLKKMVRMAGRARPKGAGLFRRAAADNCTAILLHPIWQPEFGPEGGVDE